MLARSADALALILLCPKPPFRGSVAANVAVAAITALSTGRVAAVAVAGVATERFGLDDNGIASAPDRLGVAISAVAGGIAGVGVAA